MKIAIPGYFEVYNNDMRESPDKDWTPLEAYYDNISATGGKPGDCIECGACESVCPQQLEIINLLKKVKEHFE